MTQSEARQTIEEAEQRARLKEACKQYAATKKEIAELEKTTNDLVQVQNTYITKAAQSYRENIAQLKTDIAPKLKELTTKLSVLDGTITKDLTEQVKLEDGTKVNVQNTRNLEIVEGKDFAFFESLGKQVKGSQENVKFNFAQCKVLALIDAKALKLDPEIAEIKESKSVKVTYPKAK